ncbi:hypothetical protein H9Q72_006336 [Fusarium xylarioides]|uniref:Uncharacterized protein n=1 Tax=Fusarium xylarioides TaxID=221167 RepID=A0A9P7HSR2_9HYPO|nr:hypothetical protein H9Q72_006336 [Fusarium xylarioides]
MEYYLHNLAVFKPERQAAIIRLILAIEKRESQRLEGRDITWSFGQDAVTSENCWRNFSCWHEVRNALNQYYYTYYTSEEGDPVGLGVHIPPQEAPINVNMFVARLAEEVGHTDFLGVFNAHREEAMTLLELIVEGKSTQPQEFAQVAAQIAIHAPRKTKNCLYPLPGGSWGPPQEKWEKHKNLWETLTNHEIPGLQELAWEACLQMCIADVHDTEGSEQITE